MLVVNSSAVAIFCCFITMLGWGSWANTQKLAGRERWPFPLYYWDYAWGVLLFAALFLVTAGSSGSAGESGWTNLGHAAGGPIGAALVSGIEFNVSNLLLVAAIDAAGMSVAFPVGVGLALVIGTVKSYLSEPKGNPMFLFAGVGLVLLAMVFSAWAHSRLPRRAGGAATRGLIFAVVAGCLMGLFYPQLMSSISPDFRSAPVRPGMLTPYAALLYFAAGVVGSNFVVNTISLRLNGLKFSKYTAGSVKLHSLGVLGGVIWMVALSLNVLASGVAGPAVSYALGQGATLVAAVWGVFVWKEFRSAPESTRGMLGAMFACYAAGLVLIGWAGV
jgi:glucose uptake protein